jgi:hypothetical protein
MKSKVLFLVFTLYTNMSWSQEVVLEISKVEISNYDNKRVESGIVSMDDLQGPFLIVHCKIINQTNCPITIHPSKAKYQLLYNYETDLYNRELFPLTFIDNISLDIAPRGSVEFTADEWLFIGTPIFDMKKKDYLLDLVKVLPTMEVTYQDKNYKLSTKGARVIVVK